MASGASSLLDNPFAVLGVTARATRAELNAALDRVLWDGNVDESAAQRAFDALIVPRERLRAEVSFLPGLAPAKVKAALAQLRAGASNASEDELGSLAFANVLASLPGAPDPKALAQGIVRAHTAVTPAAVRALLESDRQLSGERPPSDAELADALRSLTQAHAEVAARGLATPDHRAFADAVVRSLPAGDTPTGFGEAFAAAYKRESAAMLEEADARIAKAERSLRAKPTRLAAAALACAVRDWDATRQPLQTWDARSGRDDPDSREMGQRLRGLCIDLANKHDAYAEARVVLDALLAAFGELAGLGQTLKADSAALKKLEEGAAADALLAPMQTVLDQFAANGAGAAKGIVGAMVTSSQPRVKALRAAFATVAQADASGAIRLVRGFAIRLHNEQQASGPAALFLEWMCVEAGRRSVPDALRQQVAEDLTIVRRELLLKQLKEAMEARDWSKAEALREQITPIAKDRQQLAMLRAIGVRISDARGRKRAQMFWWAAGVGGLMLFLANAGDDPATTYTPDAAYDTTTTETTTAPSDSDAYLTGTDTAASSDYDGQTTADAVETTEAPDAAATTAVPDWAASAVATAPASEAATGGLTPSESAACDLRSTSLDRERGYLDQTDQAALDDFNRRITDYNRECAGE